MLNWIRGKVSLNKKRFQEEDYDLDLSYIGDRIIAMGFPAQGFEALYRNDFEDVRNFLDEKHGDKYWVYNLCSERSYNCSVFNNRVSNYPFDDHNPPHFDMIRQFCVHAQQWIEKDPQNIAVVHCKAGKGRTGVMICALLIHLHYFNTAAESLSFYGRNRTFDEKGVTIPSQRRYVLYYAKYLQMGVPLDQPFVSQPCAITKIIIKNPPSSCFSKKLSIKFTTMPGDPEIKIETRGKNNEPIKNDEEKTLEFDVDGILPMYAGDFRIACVKGGKNVWYMWFNSEFILPMEEFSKADVDKITKDKSVSADFRMIVYSKH
ncbi:phosphatidylinositol-3,4,5-trisphosphate 3-phosphatase, putative [Trichomonas vaginalis G3]|uniref:Phosphatidylinositol-3,4,5-trisphosphate 3-phosphatase, putative n=1 Tax=Trichomonas vaginalis (strain ATCC PRA-98 / G3) TaxID=412133 RepID=A2E0J8_TRIV3|nr:phosphatidylinositol-3,4,5-trisphosphate 3-phosphatase protein [Trichomonas vaginalis G3]EAY13878.1 phosphatidylinositol-3,4,5-trisphosphate 3-phosphatase, putative [Trichomonas vaginalis G3]KAI5520420.1 phosphatidylinositol-3,4,5-trisphosphate 3-phosphatase protein [Trichomonas vaginalis G3]|eukprot:XP_001326101.1 phosphatidylinositol-3,4,5-trisphosphate 3-phosphatase [Trichomonas vaginalis G3]